MVQSIPQALDSRPDVDILEEIDARVIHSYPPLLKNRHRFNVAVQNGHVTLDGHINAPQTLDYLLGHIARVPGVRGVHADALYDDESLRLALGDVLPYGVSVIVQYGGVLLFGTLAEGTTQAQVEAAVLGVQGVRSVVSNLRAR